MTNGCEQHSGKRKKEIIAVKHRNWRVQTFKDAIKALFFSLSATLDLCHVPRRDVDRKVSPGVIIRPVNQLAPQTCRLKFQSVPAPWFLLQVLMEK